MCMFGLGVGVKVGSVGYLVTTKAKLTSLCACLIKGHLVKNMVIKHRMTCT